MRMPARNELSVRTGLRVVAAGSSQYPTKATFDAYGRRVYGFSSIAYLVSGNGHFAARNIPKRAVSAGDVMVAFPGIWNTFGPAANDPWDEYYVSFDGFIAEHYRETGVLDPNNPVIHIGDDGALREMFRSCMREMAGGRSHTDLAVMLFRILMRIAESTSKAAHRTDVAVDEVVAEMKKVIQLPVFDMEHAAGRTPVSISSLRKRFKSYTGYSPTEYFHALKIESAKGLLCEPTRSIAEISRMFGFSDQYHFSRIFKRIAGIPPREWRSMANR